MAMSRPLPHAQGAPQQPAQRADLQPASTRVDSIDIFRGLTMVVMVLVNQLAEIRGLPWWTYHMPGAVNGMTYVDMIFPFFLFIVGISIPLAIRHRMSKGDSELDLWRHAAVRSLGLILLGLILANGGKVDPAATGIGGRLWTFLALVGAILYWNIYPRSQRHRSLFTALKYAGAMVMGAMLVIFRRVSDAGTVAWLDFSYWEILGMIGWTYLGSAILYLPTRRWRWSAGAWFAALSVLNALCAAHWMSLPYHAPYYIWPLKSGAGASLVMAGIFTSVLLLSDAFSADRRRTSRWALAGAALLLIAAAALAPLGISKAGATPSYILVCASAAILIFVALYWICDVRGQVRWAAFARPAGANTLLTYLLPDLSAAVCGGAVLLERWDHGWPGVLQAILFTAVIVAVSALLTRCRVRIQL